MDDKKVRERILERYSCKSCMELGQNILQLEEKNEELLEMVRRCRPFINFSSPNHLADEIDKILEESNAE